MTDRWRGVVADVERAGSSSGRERLGAYSIEGTRLLERAVRAGVPLIQVLVASSYGTTNGERGQRLMAELGQHDCEVVPAPDTAVEGLIGGRGTGAIVGLVAFSAESSVPGMLDPTSAAATQLLLAVDITEPGNTGALVRTALAGGAQGLLATGETDPFHPKAVRTSMGSLFKLPVRRFTKLDQALDELDRAGVDLVAAVSRGGSQLPATDFGRGPVAVAVGSEAFGLPERLLERARWQVSIPMPAEVDSFSVHAAAAILLYEIGLRRFAQLP